MVEDLQCVSSTATYICSRETAVTPVLLVLLEVRDQWESVDLLDPQDLMVAR